MKNQKPIVNQKNFRQKVAKLSKQHFLAIVVKPMRLGIRAWTCPYCDFSAIHRWSWHSQGAHRWPWRSHSAHPWPAMVQRWSIADIEKKSEKNQHVHVVKMKVKSHERQNSTIERKARKEPGLWRATGWRSTENRWRRWTLGVQLGGRFWNSCNALPAKITPKRVWKNRSFADILLLKNTRAKLSKQKLYIKHLHQLRQNDPSVPHNELTSTAVRSIRIEAQAQKNRDSIIIVTGLITESYCIVVCDIAKEIGITLTDTFFKIRRFLKDNKQAVWAIHGLDITEPYLSPVYFLLLSYRHYIDLLFL